MWYKNKNKNQLKLSNNPDWKQQLTRIYQDHLAQSASAVEYTDCTSAEG